MAFNSEKKTAHTNKKKTFTGRNVRRVVKIHVIRWYFISVVDLRQSSTPISAKFQDNNFWIIFVEFKVITAFYILLTSEAENIKKSRVSFEFYKNQAFPVIFKERSYSRSRMFSDVFGTLFWEEHYSRTKNVNLGSQISFWPIKPLRNFVRCSILKRSTS